MCGIVGHIASSPSQRSCRVVMDGLARLEYRGYDSAGVALASPGRLEVVREVGKLANLRAAVDRAHPVDATAGIGHTRWATHGRPTVANAHPHCSPDGRFALVHNGIIENADALRAQLIADGAVFASETDTEVVVHMIARAYDGASPASYQGGTAGLTGADADVARRLVVAMRAVTEQLEGTFTLLVVSTESPNAIVAARRSSPLVVGLGNGENFLGSDALAFVEHTRRAVEIEQDQIVVVAARGVTVVGTDGQVVAPKEYEVDFSSDRATKNGWPTFMEKEIHEQPEAVGATLADRVDSHGHLALDEVRIPVHVLRSVDKVIMIGCGTASYAGQVARYAIEHWCRIPVEVELSSEFRYRDPVVTEKTLVVAISQSGETMDTIQAIRHAREQGAKVVAVVNTPGSTISRESDAVVLTHAGPEIAVASTKAFTAQVAACYILGLYLAQVRGNKYADEIADYMDKLAEVPAKIERVLERGEAVRQFARTMAGATSVIYLGRHVGFPVAMEGALKLKEICYIHAEGFAAGELKHGPIALVDEGQPVIVIVPTPRRPELHNKVLANIEEVRARGARTIVVAEEGDSSVDAFADVVFRVPPVPTLYAPLLTVVPLQIFACELAGVKGLDVDQPRNLAKSVTVE
ncbi:glutamine--fructose-6-phosphate transaminase (isomerizing) [Pauljensenia hongkongensis]|uniref:Glutamine--fructose-6-phosphate aminotransferase [isomerizing] n=1 Tax=Pauljensenia hongkongensis TaxID=178339 RepID=A0A1D8B218_9ACTO|nr:glutamine--fructose-6-phosphate transaminase (isomerizing) [Pauljensenia hongkongensis]AOS47178.1 glutamine--fructose-6-phosphate aminotransferase [Pauljensenia hongkongensis]EFW10111.1 glucosamine-fructose-6-phosphate aminotransferase [Actinomyces sp. oral taxon 178 str. F0338]